MSKILFLLSEYGFWGEELVGPLEILEGEGYTVDIATPTGNSPMPLPPSMDSKYIDPPLGKEVVTEEMAKKVKKLRDSGRLMNPINLTDYLGERPYMSEDGYLRSFEAYNQTIEQAGDFFLKYDALVLVGGSGPIVDMVNNQRVHDLILMFYNAQKPIAAECYGVACLAFAREYWTRKSILWGKHVTGHPLEYDYKDGTGFLGIDFNMGPPPYPLEFILRDAVGPDGLFLGNVGKTISVIVDYPFITGRSTGDSYETGRQLVRVLKDNVRRFGW